MKISKSELQALESGDSWHDKDIFRGKLNWEKIHNTVHSGLTIHERLFLSNEVNDLLKLVDNERIHTDGYIPKKIWDFLKENLFFGLCISKEYGGLGFSHLLHSRVVEKISTHSIPVAITTMVPNSLGPGELIHKYGTDEQKDYYLPRLATGKDIPCFGLTSTNAGSDAEGSQDSYGIVTDSGIKLNFEKRFITLAPVATLIGIAFKLYDPDHIWSDKTDRGMCIALLPRDIEGMHIGDMLNPLDVPFENGTILGKNVMITSKMIIGEAGGIGIGWKMLVECLGIGRSISLPSLSSGMAKKILHHTTHYALRRNQFGLPIVKFEGIEDKLADMIAKTYMINSMKDMTLGALGLGLNPSVLSALGKYNTTEMARDVMNHGMDICAGSAIILGERNKIARYYQVSPVGITVEGANVLTRSLIGFGQGMMKNHPYAFTEVKALMSNDKFLLIKTGLKHVGFFFKNKMKILFELPYKKTNYEAQLNIASTKFAFLTDILMGMYREDLKKKEYISGRMADIFSKIYIGISICKYSKTSDSDFYINNITSNYILQTLMYEIYELIKDVCDNIKLGFMIKPFLMLSGNPYKKPSDKMKHKFVTNYLFYYNTYIISIFKILYDNDEELVDLALKGSTKIKSKYKLKTIQDYKDFIVTKQQLKKEFESIETKIMGNIDIIKEKHESLMVDHNGDKSEYDNYFKDLDIDLRK